MENPCERSSLILGLGLTPGEQLGEAGGTGGTARFLVPARGSGLKELPSLPLTGLVFSWPQDQVEGNSIFLPEISSLGAVDELPDGICSGWNLCPLREPTAAGCTQGVQCFQPIRVCRCWAVAEASRVG